MKHRLSFAVAWLRVLSKFLTELLQRSLQAFDRSITHRVAAGANPVFSCAAFSVFVGLGASLNRILFWSEDRVFAVLYGDLVRVIPVVEQNDNLRDIDGLGAKVIRGVTQQFNSLTKPQSLDTLAWVQ